MKRTIEVISLVLVFYCSPGFAAEKTDTEDLTRMFLSVQQNDMDLFKQLLDDGVDPSALAHGESFKFTSFCESTKPGNEEYFELIVAEGARLENPGKYINNWGSPLLCAIAYKNFFVYERLIALGVDVNAVQNPKVTRKKSLRRPLSYTLLSNRIDFAWDIIQRIEVSEDQIRRMVRYVEGNPGYEDNPQQVYRQQIIQWLIDRGVEVNPSIPGVPYRKTQ